jgi:hypothetical protein
MMNERPSSRKEIIKLTNDRSEPVLLCLEPLGEQVTLNAHGTYEIITSGGDEGPVEMFLADGKLTVYGWNGSDSEVFHNGRRVAGLNTSR